MYRPSKTFDNRRTYMPFPKLIDVEFGPCDSVPVNSGWEPTREHPTAEEAYGQNVLLYPDEGSENEIAAPTRNNGDLPHVDSGKTFLQGHG